MLVMGEPLQDALISEVSSYLRAGDILVLNDTKVIPARLYGLRGTAKIEVLLHKRKGEHWQCFLKPGKKVKPGDRIQFADNFFADVIGKQEDGQALLAFNCDAATFRGKLAQHGHMPLPPYIEKIRHADSSDHAHYQTVFARHEGSVAAPTAGLHFTPELLENIQNKGVSIAYVTLHVSGGTFLPVKVEDTKDHIMHSEWAQVSKETADQINQAKSRGGRVIAVGTTALRTLESATDTDGRITAFAKETDIFITPGYQFKAVDLLLTNFHLPKSTLFMLVCAFAGLEPMKAAYRHAIAQKYRFYSYGDACLLTRKP